MKAFAPDDLYLHQRVMSLHCVAQLDLAAGAVRSVDRRSDSYASCIWAFPTDGAPARQLTRGPGQDHSPRWSPDGRQLAFLSSRGGGTPQLYVMPRSGGKARQLGDFELGVSALKWSADSKALLVGVTLRVDPQPRGRRGPPPPGDACVPRREIHLFTIDTATATGEARQLTEGAFDVQGFAQSPNGKHLVYTRTRDGRLAHCTDLWVCDTQGEYPRRLTHDHATVQEPAWSPDGKWIAFAGAIREGDGPSSLWLLDFATGRVTPLGPKGLEVADAGNLIWSEDSRQLLLACAWRGRHEIVSLSVPGGVHKTLTTGSRQLAALACNGQRLVYAVNTPDLPSEVFACGLDGRGERQLSHLNPWWRERMPIQIEARRFDEIDGWLLRTQGNEGPMPLLVDIHSRPGYAPLDFDANVQWHALCSRGWTVLLLNIAGSCSVGSEFGDDQPPHLIAIRQLQAQGVCDERVTIAGPSAFDGEQASELSGKPSARADAARRVIDWATRPAGEPESQEQDTGEKANSVQHEGSPG